MREQEKIQHRMLIKIRNMRSIAFSVIKAIGLIAEPTPSTSRILKMFDPMTFPTAISTSFFRAATIEVTSSGRLVPIAQIVSPISVWLIRSDVRCRIYDKVAAIFDRYTTKYNE